jgi:hypothetical protein
VTVGIYDVVNRLQRTAETHQRRMAPGDLGGRTESASPARPMDVVSPLPIQKPNGGGALSFAVFARTTSLSTASGGVGTPVGMTTIIHSEGSADYALGTGGKVQLLTEGVYMAQGVITFDGSISTGTLRRAYFDWDTWGHLPGAFVHQVPPIPSADNAVAFSHLGHHAAGVLIYPRALHDASSNVDLMVDASYNFCTFARLR